MSSRRGLTVVLIAACFCGPAPADTVEMANATGGSTKLTGRVLDYTGRTLTMEFAGRRRDIPGDRVLRVTTDRGANQLEADRLSAAGRLDEALALYHRALEEEKRAWVKRKILADMVWCYRGLGRFQPAGMVFLALVQQDPETPYFDCIPLAWISAQPAPLLEQTARQWLAQEPAKSPAAVLLGASHLLPTSQRLEALGRLRQLATHRDRRIALLAQTQLWRTVAAVDDGQLAAWQRFVEQMPEPLRAGPYYVLGQARLQRHAWEQAALALMRVPILYPRHRQLAAQSLLAAGQSLEQLHRPKQSARLYRELIRTYPKTRPALEARNRLEKSPTDGS